MIEDLQDELQHEQPRKKEVKTHSKGVLLFFAFIVWIIYSAIIILTSLPRMIRAIRESDIQQTIYNLEDLKRASGTRDAKLCFVVPKSDGSASFVVCNQRVIKTGASEYHDAIEGLLDGPKESELSIGAITYIDPSTGLVGLTVSHGTAFVNLTESFTRSGSSWGPGGLDIAKQQITRTLQALDPSIKNVVILINGEELSI